MADKIFKKYGVDIRVALKPLSDAMLAMTLHRRVAGVLTAGKPTLGRSVSYTAVACRGMISTYAQSEIDGTLVQAGDRKALLFGVSLGSGVVPVPEDLLTWTDEEGTQTWAIIAVPSRDPAEATYTVQLRGKVATPP